VHVYRWDLDKTYLHTEIDSVRGLVRAALEHADEKKTVPGAAALLQAIVAHDPAARICVLSGSPTQMRAVLEAKLALDGVRVDRLFLKDNLGNLRRGRLRAVRGQIGYKLPLLLEERLETPEHNEMLFGDDSETDALIYTAYAELLAGKLDEAQLVNVLRLGDAYPDAIERAVAAARRIARVDAVRDIFIRIDRGVPVATFRLLGPRVMPVFSWYQAALVLYARGRLPVGALPAIAKASGEPAAISGLVTDAVRRGLVDAETAVAACGDDEPLAHATRKVLERLGVAPVPPRSEPDYSGFFAAVRRR
jgi:hypothetical protein